MTERWCKSSLAVVLTSVMLYGWIDQKIKGLARDNRKHKYGDYVSNWNEISCCIWAVVCAVNAIRRTEATNWMVKWQRFQHSMAATSSVTITLIYWNMMDEELVSYKPHSLHQHGMLAILTCTTFIISKFRYPLWHIITGWLFAGVYSIYAGMIYFLYGDERDAVYSFAEYGKGVHSVWKMQATMVFGVQSVIFLILIGMHRSVTCARNCRNKPNKDFLPEEKLKTDEIKDILSHGEGITISYSILPETDC